MTFRYLFAALGSVALLAAILRLTVVSTFVMSGNAMVPHILPGEYLLATTGNVATAPRGATVVLRCPGPDVERTCLKRIAAVAGDRVDARNGALLVNDNPLDPPLTTAGPIKLPLVVPPDHVLVRNERDEDTEDSRSWGPLPSNALEARVRFVWLSLDWFEPDGDVRDWPRWRPGRVFRPID